MAILIVLETGKPFSDKAMQFSVCRILIWNNYTWQSLDCLPKGRKPLIYKTGLTDHSGMTARNVPDICGLCILSELQNHALSG